MRVFLSTCAAVRVRKQRKCRDIVCQLISNAAMFYLFEPAASFLRFLRSRLFQLPLKRILRKSAPIFPELNQFFVAHAGSRSRNFFRIISQNRCSSSPRAEQRETKFYFDVFVLTCRFGLAETEYWVRRVGRFERHNLFGCKSQR